MIGSNKIPINKIRKICIGNFVKLFPTHAAHSDISILVKLLCSNNRELVFMQVTSKTCRYLKVWFEKAIFDMFDRIFQRPN